MGKYSIVVAQVVVDYYKNSQMFLLVYFIGLLYWKDCLPTNVHIIEVC